MICGFDIMLFDVLALEVMLFDITLFYIIVFDMAFCDGVPRHPFYN